MAALTTAARRRLRSDQFGLPERARTARERGEPGNYPVPDKAHARDAKARASEAYRDGRISRAERDRIFRKADLMLDAGRHPTHGRVFVVPTSGEKVPRRRVKPDSQPQYRMKPVTPRRPRGKQPPRR